VNRCQILYARGQSVARIAREMSKSPAWVRAQLAQRDDDVWEIDRTKPLPEALLDRIQGGHPRDTDPEVVAVAGEIVEIAQRLDSRHHEAAQEQASIERIAHHLADGATPATDPLIGINLRLARELIDAASQ
jgi:hypothetical protein